MKIAKLIITLIILVTGTQSFAATTLDDSYFSGFKQYTCGYVNSTWVPGVRSGNSFETFKEIAELHRAYANRNRRNKKVNAYYIRLAQRVEAKHRAAAAGCKKKRAPSVSSSVTTLAKLPSLDGLVRENTSTSTFRPQAVIGTPPVLTSIGTVGSKNVFWNPGVVDAIRTNTASPGQCSQFHGSNTDGESAGYGGCSMSQSVIQNLDAAINSGNTLCYMKNVATTANFAARAIRIIEGRLPTGGINALFAPGASNRIVGVRAVGDSEEESSEQYFGFIRIYSTSELASGDNRFKYDFWSCENGSLEEIQQATISNSGNYSIRSYNLGENSGDFSINARVTFASDGSVAFDTTQDRTLVGNSIHTQGSSKVIATITPDNTISSKFFSNFGTDTNYGVNLANFSGSNFLDLRFLSGAFKDRFFRNGILQHSTTAGMEYRSTNYAAAPAIPELAVVSAINLDSDPFFSTPAAISAPSGFSCSVSVDVGAEMDFNNPLMSNITEICEGGRVENLGFCWQDPDVSNAQAVYHTSCP